MSMIKCKNCGKQNKRFEIICRIFLALAAVVEIIFTVVFLKDMGSIWLACASIINIVSYILLCFAFNRKKNLARKAVILRILGSILYLIGFVLNAQEILIKFLGIIVYVFAIIIWSVIYQNMKGIQWRIFQRAKILYVVLPLFEPIVYTWVVKDVFSLVLFGIGALATIFVGGFCGWNLCKDFD